MLMAGSRTAAIACIAGDPCSAAWFSAGVTEEAGPDCGRACAAGVAGTEALGDCIDCLSTGDDDSLCNCGEIGADATSCTLARGNQYQSAAVAIPSQTKLIS